MTYTMKIVQNLIVTSFVLLTFGNVCRAQSLDELQQQYSDEYGVYTKYYQHLDFYFDKNELKVKLDVENEKVLLDPAFATAFSTESVHHSYFSTLNYLEAVTLIPTDKGFKPVKSVNTKVKSSRDDYVFYDDSKETEVSYNNLQKGNRTSIKYGLTFRDVYMTPKVLLQSYLPIVHMKLEISLPKGLSLNEYLMGLDTSIYKRTEVETRNGKLITWEARNVPKLKFYSDAPGVSNYINQLALTVDQYKNPKNGAFTYYMGKPGLLAKYLSGYIKDINRQPDAGLTAKVNEITAKESSEADKAKVIFKWVQDNVRYVAFEDSLGGFVPREAALVYSRKFGDCKDMSSLLKAMCEAAGLQTSFVWIGTRKLPYAVSKTAMPGAFNHMIAAVKINGKWTFLDATDNTIPFGAIPYSIQGKEAFLVNQAGDYEIVKMPVAGADKAILKDSSVVKIDNDVLSGQAYLDIKGYRAWSLNALLKYKSESDIEKTFQRYTRRGNNKYDQTAFQYKFDNNDQRAVHITTTFTLKDYIRSLDNQYFVNLHLNKLLQDGKVESDKRKVPISLDYNQSLHYVVSLVIPEGYVVSHMPENINQHFESIGSLVVTYVQEKDKVQMNCSLKLEALEIKADQFEQYNQMITTLQKAYKESVAITKK